MESLYKRRIADGKCGMCGKDRGENPKVCDGCQEKARQQASKQRAKKSKKGCPRCGAPGKPGVTCSDCKQYACEKAKETRDARREAGLCPACGGQPMPDSIICKDCSEQRSAVAMEHFQRRKKAGLCSYCNTKPLKGYAVCQRHLAYYAGKRKQLKLAALDAYGGAICSVPGCGCQDVDVLEIDHIDGGGRQHRITEKIEGGNYFYQWLKNNDYPKGFRVLCANHNKKAHLKKLRDK